VFARAPGEGQQWLYTWGSGRFSGIARDAHFVADHVERRLRAARFAQRGRVVENGERLETLAMGS
jgi:hypothetical protein